MIGDELVFQIEKHFGHVPTDEQRKALQLFANFMADRDDHAVMILRGSAGTGKTTLAAAIVRGLLALNQKLVLMAPTGRAAKVFALIASHPAYTIHRRIYRQRTAADLSSFNLNDNLHTDTLFIVDEASMIAAGAAGTTGASGATGAIGASGYSGATGTSGTTGSTGTSGYFGTSGAFSPSFGSGSLLDDLVQYVYSGTRCRLMLIGDAAQLPPVGETLSPALSAEVLSAYGLHVYEADLSEVLRQAQASGILYNATRIRFSVGSGSAAALPKILAAPFPDITLVPGDELIEQLASSYSHAGLDETIVITRSNKRANIYNQGIRRTILDREDELCRGDQLMIVKNNYSLTPGPSPKERGVYTPSAGNTSGISDHSPGLPPRPAVRYAGNTSGISNYSPGLPPRPAVQYAGNTSGISDHSPGLPPRPAVQYAGNTSGISDHSPGLPPRPAVRYAGNTSGISDHSPLPGRGAGGEAPSFLANGDRCVVQRVRNKRDMHGFRFADVTLLFPDYGDYELTTTVLLDTLFTDAPALTREQQQQLFDRVMADYADIPLKADRMKAVRKDPFYNALQVKFGYAITCHKAQGGQWQHVYIDQGYIADNTVPDDYLRWLYTAFTRATERLFLVNWPEAQSEKTIK